MTFTTARLEYQSYSYADLQRERKTFPFRSHEFFSSSNVRLVILPFFFSLPLLISLIHWCNSLCHHRTGKKSSIANCISLSLPHSLACWVASSFFQIKRLVSSFFPSHSHRRWTESTAGRERESRLIHTWIMSTSHQNWCSSCTGMTRANTRKVFLFQWMRVQGEHLMHPTLSVHLFHPFFLSQNSLDVVERPIICLTSERPIWRRSFPSCSSCSARPACTLAWI